MSEIARLTLNICYSRASADVYLSDENLVD